MLISRVRRQRAAAGIALQNFRSHGHKWPVFITSLALCTCIQSALAQSVRGSIAGNIHNGTGITIETEQVETGAKRSLSPSANHYSVNGLAPGEYIVRVTKDGHVIAIRRLIVDAGAAATLDINAATTQANTLEAINVKAPPPSPIDVTTPFSSTIMRRQDLNNLAVPQLMWNIATLQSNVRSESTTGTPLPAFNGATPAENRFYLNGFDVTLDDGGLGYSVPNFEALGSTEIISHGFSAKYGNAVGGVLSSVTRTGTNELHGGTVLNYTPSTGSLNPHARSSTTPAGTWYKYRNASHSDSKLTQAAYLSGPLIKDRLFFSIVGNRAYPLKLRDATSNQRYDNIDSTTGKMIDLTWNITDRQSLNTLYSRTSTRQETDYSNLATKDNIGSKTTYVGSSLAKNFSEISLADYQWNITDTFHAKAMAGYIRYDRSYSGSFYETPYVRMYTAPDDYRGVTLNGIMPLKPDNYTYTKRGYRVDFGWDAGDHTIGFGAEWYKIFMHDVNYYPNFWSLRPVPTSGKVNNVSGLTPGSYYAVRYKETSGGSVDSTKLGIYIEDTWRASDDVKVYLGLRRDNYDSNTTIGTSFAKMGITQPRLGVVWDIDGDGERKLSASLGRYALQLPLTINRSVGASKSTNETYYTYTGLGSDSVPTGLTQIGNVSVTSDSVVTDARLVSSQNIKPSYEDQLSVTYQQSLAGITNGWLGRAAQGWYASAVGSYRNLKNVAEDTCDGDRRNSYIRKVLNYPRYKGETVQCIMVNPGKDQVLLRDIDSNGSLERITIPATYLGIDKVKRKSLGMTLQLLHPYSNHFYAQLGYTWQHLYGNYDGAMDVSGKTAGGVSASTAFNLASLTPGSTGNLGADIRHSFKGNGYYQWDNGIRLGGSAQLYSGRPLNCFGTGESISYAGDYFFCDKKLVPRGSAGRLSWNWSIDLDVGYTLKLANNWGAVRFDLRMQNVTNRHGIVDRNEIYENRYGRNVGYNSPGYQSPRSTWFTARYDF